MPIAKPILPYGRQAIDEDDIAAVASVLRSDWLTTGPATQAFETALAENCHAAHAVSCANGTAALHLACLALGLGASHTVIVPTITFAATANAPRFIPRPQENPSLPMASGVRLFENCRPGNVLHLY